MQRSFIIPSSYTFLLCPPHLFACHYPQKEYFDWLCIIKSVLTLRDHIDKFSPWQSFPNLVFQGFQQCIHHSVIEFTHLLLVIFFFLPSYSALKPFSETKFLTEHGLFSLIFMAFLGVFSVTKLQSFFRFQHPVWEVMIMTMICHQIIFSS